LVEIQEEPPGLKAMAEAAGLSPFHFHRVFKRLVGVTPKAYVAARKAGRLRCELAAGTPVAEAIYGAGYGSPSRVYEGVGATLGMTPAVYRQGGRGERIGWTVVPTPLGELVIGATARGICLIEFMEPESSPEARLATRFPAARIERADADFEDVARRVVAYIAVPARGLDLPLDLRGTAFQQRVWQALRNIPPGATASYGEIARRIGQPKAARAVARACATNSVALAVPCHRVVAADGAPGGYRWGRALKTRLLEGEGAAEPVTDPSSP
jgi:AraC family transcriptional regulator of adaptative response/methylated-DNA-[protein]-cysteine methyltransferase